MGLTEYGIVDIVNGFGKNKIMKLRFMHGESFITYCGKGEYVIDTDNFPELKGMNEDQVIKWLYEHQEDVAINSEYEDVDAEREGVTAYEVVPLDPENEEMATLYDYTSDSSVEWDKIKNEEDYFRVRYNMATRDEPVDQMIARLDKEYQEKISNGLYEI
jgi:hypothetical protein